MSSFAFQTKVPMTDATASSSLSETMGLTGDHVLVNYLTEFDGADMSDLAKSVRNTKPKFSDDAGFLRDVQVAVDENYLNHMLFQMFYKEQSYSATEALISILPENFIGGSAGVKAVMNTQVWQFLFPSLKKDYPSGRGLDFRCGFSKDYLKKGHLEESRLSQVYFREGNRVDMDLHFGCGLFVYDQRKQAEGLEAILDLFKQVNADPSDPKWKEQESFFISMSA